MLPGPHDVQVGVLLGARYSVDELAAEGGMGALYRGTDTATGSSVAIKLLASGQLGQASRFTREISLLSRLVHPAIVRYRDSGLTDQGLPYLVMEWLEGETLRQRLLRSELSVAQAIVVVRRICEALTEAHAAGVIHRDLKPSNLFLVDGHCEQLKVLDFGVARQQELEKTLTQPGAILGTVGYMSPEQALGSGGVDQRSDLFAVGCILYECLAGRAAFTGTNSVAILAKILRETPPALSQLRADVSEELAALVASLLAKEPSDRPADTEEVLGVLSTLDAETVSRPYLASTFPRITSSERKIVSVILGQAPSTERGGPLPGAAGDEEDGSSSDILHAARGFGVDPVWLRDGSMMMIIAEQGTAADQSAVAARCALALQQRAPGLRLGVATGRVEMSVDIPTGGAIDVAAEVLNAQQASPPGVAIDDTTAALLEQSFVIQRSEQGSFVVAERRERTPARRLLGAPTPFVGRRKELALLERTLAECVEDSVARVALVLARPGQGKSRLRHEFVAGLHETPAPKVLLAHADPTGAGSVLSLVRQLVRRAVGLKDDSPATEQHMSLQSYLESLCPGADTQLLREFLGELVGAPSTSLPSTELRAARNDPKIMGTWLPRSFVQLLKAECERQPLLLVLDDLHWADATSLTYLAGALRELATRPLMILGLARPEIEQSVPRLWSSAEPQLVRLGRLTPRAAEQLVKAVLGDRLDARIDLARLVERADGNPFHLEELMRRVVEGDVRTLPETVLALVQSRLDRLEPHARRFVRAASLFGETFWSGGVYEVLGRGPLHEEGSDHILNGLLDDELIILQYGSRFHSEQEYLFSHGLLREAAYASLTEEDRRHGHLLVGLWLERMGANDSQIIALHFELAAAPERALPWLLNAAREAADGGDVEAAIQLAQRGFECGAVGEVAGQLHLVLAEAHVMRSDWHQVIKAGRAATAALEQGSAPWFAGVAAPLVAATFVGDTEFVVEALQKVLASPLPSEPTAAVGQTVSWASLALLNASQTDFAVALLGRARVLAESVSDVEPLFWMWLHAAQGYHRILQRDLGGALTELAAAQGLAQRTHSLAGRALSGMFQVLALSQTGHVEQTVAAAQQAQDASEPARLSLASDWVTYYKAIAMTRAATEDLQGEVLEPIRALLQGSDHRLLVSARALLALALTEQGQLAEAETQAVHAVSEARFPLEQAVACSAKAHVAIAGGRYAEALEHAERALAASQTGVAPRTFTMMQLDRVRALHGLGQREAAHGALREARDEVLRVASTLQDPELHSAYLQRVDVNRMVLELAQEWRVDAPR